MNFFDLVFLLILVWASLRGWFKGISHQLFGFLALLIGTIVAETWALPFLESQSLLSANAGVPNAVVYGIVLFILLFIGRLIYKFTAPVTAQMIDQNLPKGIFLIFSFGQTCLIGSMIFYLFSRHFPAFSEELNQSQSLQWIGQIRPWLGGVNLAL